MGIFRVILLTGIALVFASCPYELSRFPVLPGDVRITPGTEVTVNTQVTVEYIPKYSGTYTEQVSYQWSRDGIDIPGETSTIFTPVEPGAYTVTMSAYFYESIDRVITATNEADNMNGALSGELQIMHTSDATVGEELAAEYSGSEGVSFQWNLNGVALYGEIYAVYVPRLAGAYSVTVSAAGYGTITSGAVIISSPYGNLPGNITLNITNNISVEVLSVQYYGIEGVTYQWYRDGSPIQGATDETYDATVNGEYTVAISMKGYDSIISDPIVVADRRNSSSNADLASLSSSAGPLNLAAGTSVYAQTVPNVVTATTVTAIAVDSNATVVISPQNVPMPLVVGENSITITVVAEDGITIRVYTLIITRNAALSSNALLSYLSIAGIPIDVSAGPGNYAVTIPYANSQSAAVIATLADSSASHNAPAQMTGLVIGANSLAITVIAADSTAGVYNITVTMHKEPGAAVSAPTLASKTHNSIILNAVNPPSNGQTVEYAVDTTNIAPSVGWQDGLTFSSLVPATTYYLFARSKENSSYAAGPSSAGLEVTTYLISPTGISLSWIPAGTYTMGSPDGTGGTTAEPGRKYDETQHEVTLTSGFYMGVYEVMQDEWIAVMGSNPSQFSTSPEAGENQGKRPVERVSWYDALVFCNKLSMDAAEGLTPAYSINGSTDPDVWGLVPTGGNNGTWDAVIIVPGSTGYRLPTEAQWEYACRAGTTTAYNDGITDDCGDLPAVHLLGWVWNCGNKTHEVGLKTANDWGLYDMHGNVFEWCWDWYDDYASSPSSDPTGPSSGASRVYRGGFWGDAAAGLRSACRSSANPSTKGTGGPSQYGFGLRLVRPRVVASFELQARR